MLRPTPGRVMRGTYYFTEETLMALEVLMLKLRTEKRLKAGKSEIMRAALAHILSLPLDEAAAIIKKEVTDA